MAMVAAARGSTGARSTATAGLLLLVTASATGAAFGALAGTWGWLLGGQLRVLLAVVAVAFVLWASLRHPRPFQLDRETHARWLRHQNWWTVVGNGIELGVGAATRLGYWLWFLVPIGAFAAGDPRAGAAVWGAYGCARVGFSLLAAWLRSADGGRGRRAPRVLGAFERQLNTTVHAAACGAVAGALLTSTFPTG